MTKEGNKTYTYGWLDKVMSITQNGKVTANYDYHVSGQIASASIYSKDERPFVSTYDWDGLALIRKSTGTNALRRTEFTNEPAVTGGNPILATNNNGTNLLFNDMLGTTIGTLQTDKFNSFKRDAFGKLFANSPNNEYNMFTGKPKIAGLGYAFLFRNYRADIGKWTTADPLGYPDGWNSLAYVNNGVVDSVDQLGLCRTINNEIIHDLIETIDQNYTVRGALVQTLSVSCGTGSRTVTIAEGNSSFSIGPSVLGNSAGSYTYTTGYVSQTVTLGAFICTLPAGTSHSSHGQKIVDYYVFSTFHYEAQVYECGEVNVIMDSPVGTSYIEGVIRSQTSCAE